MSIDQEQRHHLGACKKCRISDISPDLGEAEPMFVSTAGLYAVWSLRRTGLKRLDSASN